MCWAATSSHLAFLSVCPYSAGLACPTHRLLRFPRSLVSAMSITWPAQRCWFFMSIASISIRSVQFRIDVFVTMSCHVISIFFLRGHSWNFSSALMGRQWVAHDSLPCKREGRSIARYTAIFFFRERTFSYDTLFQKRPKEKLTLPTRLVILSLCPRCDKNPKVCEMLNIVQTLGNNMHTWWNFLEEEWNRT